MKTANMNTMILNWKSVKKMSDYLEVHVGEDWVDYFNVEEYVYLLEYLDEE